MLEPAGLKKIDGSVQYDNENMYRHLNGWMDQYGLMKLQTFKKMHNDTFQINIFMLDIAKIESAVD